VIYFIRSGEAGPVKIGHTDGEVSARLSNLQVGCPEPLAVAAALPGGPAVERWLHEALSHLRVRGEWFKEKGELAVLLRWLAMRPAGELERSAQIRLAGLAELWPDMPGDAREASLLVLNYHSRLDAEGG
jgi:hypothetical protein